MVGRGCERVVCAMSTSRRKRRILDGEYPICAGSTPFAHGFQPEAGVRVVCTVCTGVCPRQEGIHPDCQWGPIPLLT